MSRAVELAAKVGSRTKIYERHPAIDWHEMTTEQLEAFYHAARAEALREAAEVCLKYSIGLSIASHHDWPNAGVAACDLSDELRAMADREVKQ